MQRDHISEEKAREWIDAQLPQDEVVSQSHFEIINDGKEDVEAQVALLLQKLSQR